MTPPFVFMDLRTADPDVSRRFYTELFGWNVADVAGIPMFVEGAQPWGGLTQITDGDGRRPQWIPYVPVADVDAAAKRATDLGATIARPRVDIPAGSIIVIQDPTGATLALWEAASR